MSASDPLLEIVYLGREHRSLEYKRSISWADAQEKVIKTSMAMANLRDGGRIVFGVEELGNGAYVQAGMTQEHFSTFDPDIVQEAINKFADPFVRIEFLPVEHDRKRFLVINVFPFDEIPVICKKTSTPKFQAGDVYVRSNRKAETCKIESQTEMRELIELALEKALKKFSARLHTIGALQIKTPEQHSKEQFDRQLGGL